MSIFVQIAAFCDPQLLPTIRSLLENAVAPDQITFGIARQFNAEDQFDDLTTLQAYAANPACFRVINIPYTESLGVCWARHQVQQLYAGETYTLQIDSHMRFAPGWDIELITMVETLQQTGVRKPLLTAYVSSFDPEDDPAGRITEPWRMVFDKYTPEGCVLFLPETIPNWKLLTGPVPARFYSAHFAFTVGQFSSEVQHNPAFYFHGEEISIAARAYTHGYDLFHPHKVLVWHEYTRKGRVKHWDVDREWSKKNAHAHKLNRQLFNMLDLKLDLKLAEVQAADPYGFGTVRSLRDYEHYTGLYFAKRAVQQYTLDKKYPPNPAAPTEQAWLDSFTKQTSITIPLALSQVPLDDYDFWVVAFSNANNETLHRTDADANEVRLLMEARPTTLNIQRSFLTEQQVASWVVWPHSCSQGWCDKITGKLR